MALSVILPQAGQRTKCTSSCPSSQLPMGEGLRPDAPLILAGWGRESRHPPSHTHGNWTTNTGQRVGGGSPGRDGEQNKREPGGKRFNNQKMGRRRRKKRLNQPAVGHSSTTRRIVVECGAVDHAHNNASIIEPILSNGGLHQTTCPASAAQLSCTGLATENQVEQPG